MIFEKRGFYKSGDEHRFLQTTRKLRGKNRKNTRNQDDGVEWDRHTRPGGRILRFLLIVFGLAASGRFLFGKMHLNKHHRRAAHAKSRAEVYQKGNPPPGRGARHWEDQQTNTP